MAKYELIGGQHVEGTNLYSRGDIISSDRDLTQVFKGKFVKFDGRVVDGRVGDKPADKPTDTGLTIHTNPAAQADPAEPTAARGVDVTTNFKAAVSNHYLVFKKSWSHTVFDPDDMTKPLNPKALKKKDVNKFIKKFVEE